MPIATAARSLLASRKALAIAIDCDGVLLNPPTFREVLKDTLGISSDITEAFFGGVFQKCRVGLSDLKQVLPPYLESWGWTNSVDAFLRVWHESATIVNPRALNAIRAARSQGILCCLMSNQEAHRGEFLRTTLRLADAFDVLAFSFELGAVKPDSTFFEAVNRQLQEKADSVLYFDDSEVCCAAGRAVLWESVRVAGPSEFCDALEFALERSRGAAPAGA